jgi:hypothetical protein
MAMPPPKVAISTLSPGLMCASASATVIGIVYLHADLSIKEAAIARTRPPGSRIARYRPPDNILSWLVQL